MSSISWSNGQLIQLSAGDTASANGTLRPGQIYGLFFYNSANNDNDIPVTVVWSNSQPPVTVTVPGTTGNQGLASVCFVSGSDTNSVSISVGQSAIGTVSAFIGSVSMPIDTNGITNASLPLDGKPHSFNAFTRYYATPASHWYSATIQSDVNQFISVQFKENSAIVNIVNQISDPTPLISYAGTSAKSSVTINSVASQTLTWNLQGNGTQWVWVNADSIQNSQSATIAVQSLAASYAAFAPQ